MSTPQSSTDEFLLVRLAFHKNSSHQERDEAFAYLFEKLDELMNEASAFAHYRVLTDEDYPTIAPNSDVYLQHRQAF